jgi:long-chain acyl-CoA synthetase
MRKIRYAYTAGAALGPEVFQFYRSIGVNLKQVYGLTETSALCTYQPDDDVKLETVGIPCPGIEIKIGEGGEVLIKSPGVFQGYYKNPEATSEALKEGWLHTGDAGIIDKDKHVIIIDRAKDVSTLANGTIFAPQFIENKLKFSPYIKEAVILGQGREYVAAMINIDLGTVGNWAERRNIGYTSYADLSQKTEVYDLIFHEVKKVNASLGNEVQLRDAQIKRYLILHKELDPDDAEVTRTRKIRRGFIAQKYADIIDALYSGKEGVNVETKITYEDGRTATIRAFLRIREGETLQEKTK